jgi:hypothetical protein
MTIPELVVVQETEPSLELNVENTLEVTEEPLDTNVKTISIDLGNEDLSSEVVLDQELVIERKAEDEVLPESVVESEASIVETNELDESKFEQMLSDRKTIYENMAPSALKYLIVQRKLTSLDVSKMKKPKLVQILLDSDE